MGSAGILKALWVTFPSMEGSRALMTFSAVLTIHWRLLWQEMVSTIPYSDAAAQDALCNSSVKGAHSGSRALACLSLWRK